MDAKRLGLLRDLAPGVLLFGALVNPNYPAALRQLQQLEEAAGAINQRLFIAKASIVRIAKAGGCWRAAGRR